MAETENVTVLFTDLVGSTELASALSPEAGDEVRRQHFSVLRQAVAAAGGTEVKNLGDGLMVVFPAASVALNCAVGMQQAVNRDNEGSERPLGLRVGLSAGEATREADDYFGDPVIEAARLCARAGSGQILVTDLVRANAGRRSSHTFTSLGEIELKGLPDPIETLEVTWEPLAQDVTVSKGIPFPARLDHRPGVGVIGRVEELAILETAAKTMATREGRQVILVSGEPGQGKTTLVSELARRTYETGNTVLLGRCDEDVGAPYRPFAEALSHYVSYAPEGLLRSHVSDHGGELSRMVPALQRRLGELPPPQSTDPDTERYLLFAAIVGLLESASAATPVVLVIDDLHWADKPSLQLLRHVVSNTSRTHLLVIGTFRDAELSASHPLNEALAALHREPAGVLSIELKGLDDTGVISFMESAAGHQLDEAGVGLAHQVYRETDGNPFFVGEVLRNLAESGAIFQDTTGRWSAADTEGNIALPPSVRTVIGTRVSRLGDEAIRVLSTASVIGRDFDLELLAETTKADEDSLIDLLEEAQRSALVNELPEAPGCYTFSHALVQHTLYEDLGATRRTRVHRSVGEAIERLYGVSSNERVGDLARHFILATQPIDAEKAITYATRAGEAALAALAPDEAVRYFTKALELLSQGRPTAESALRLDVLIGLGIAQRQAGNSSFRENLLEAAREARELGDSARLVSAALANNRGWFTSLGQVDTEKVEVLGAALAALPKTDSPERARLLATLCSELIYGSPLEDRIALADEARAMARRLDDPATLVEVIFRSQVPLRAPSTLVEQLANGAEAIEAAENLDDPSGLFLVLNNTYSDLIMAGQFDLAERRLSVAQGLLDKVPQPSFEWSNTFIRAAHALLHGHTEAAETLATTALEVGTASGQPDAFGFYGIQLMMIRLMQGRLGELVSLLAEGADQTPAIPAYKAALADAYLEAGDTTSARTLLEEAAAKSFLMPEDNAWFDGILNYARVAIELELRDHAVALLELLAPFRDQVPQNGLIPYEPVAMYIGGLATLLGRFEEADAYFAQASELNTRGDMRFAKAHTNLLWGRMLLTRGGHGDVNLARELLEDARSIATSHGYAMVERRVTAELSKLA
jgi:class 3 adenylate cyclase/tetratricopeptide (TPR) repeat protein